MEFNKQAIDYESATYDGLIHRFIWKCASTLYLGLITPFLSAFRQHLIQKKLYMF